MTRSVPIFGPDGQHITTSKTDADLIRLPSWVDEVRCEGRTQVDLVERTWDMKVRKIIAWHFPEGPVAIRIAFPSDEVLAKIDMQEALYRASPHEPIEATPGSIHGGGKYAIACEIANEFGAAMVPDWYLWQVIEELNRKGEHDGR